VGVLKNILVGCTKNKRNQKSHNLSGDKGEGGDSRERRC